jgi:capsular exopolysaccharide synthesis family protein
MEATNGQSHEVGVETARASVQHLIAVFRRRMRLFAAAAVSFMAVALVVILTQPAVFTATTTVALNPQKQPVVTATPVQDQAPDASAMDTEAEILRSRALAVRVARELQLDRDPDFNARLRKPGLLSTLRNALAGLSPQDALRGGGSAAGRSVDLDAAVGTLQQGLRVTRVGQTFLINVSFTASRPEKAAAVANGFARGYLAMQLEGKFSATTDANEWLSGRLQQLRTQVEQADTELQQYKIANNLMSSQGATLTEQEISTLDQQLALTRAQEAEATARLSTAKRQLASGSTGEDVGEALSSPVIQQLRQQRGLTSQKVADMQGRYGDRHPEMLKAKRELADIDGQIQGEVQRIISNLEAQAQVARQRTASIEGSVGQSRGKLAGNNRAMVRLNELQRNADAVRTLYETLLNRYKETSTEKGLARTDARVVTAATPPAVATSRKALGLFLAAMAALVAGVVAVMIAELLDNGVSDGGMIESELDASYLGSIPLLSSAAETPELARLGPERYVMSRPLSSFAESIRSLNASVLFSRVGEATKVIAVTSSLPGEGKTTSSICLARTVALSGKTVVLVDCDLRQRAVNRILDKVELEVGLLEVLNGQATLDEALVADGLSGAMILPLSAQAYTPRDVFGTPAMEQLLETLRARFDVVVLDTAPVLLVTETRTLAGLADATVLAVRWRKTSKQAVAASLKLLRAANVRVAGAVLTQVDLAETAGTALGDPVAYYKTYKKYYSE